MKSDELRIGNIVEYRVFDELAEPKEEWVKNVVDLDDLKVVETSDNYRPMKLTGEIFNEFQFEWKNNALRREEFCVRQCGWAWAMYMSNEKHNMEMRLEYVHQLQNLYFALTGDELKLL